MALTGKKRRFADAVLAGLSNRDAAIAAGYSAATASAAGSRLVKDADVKKCLEAGRAAVEVKLEPQPHGGALKRSKVAPVEQPDTDMLSLLQEIALGRVDATTTQVRAAIAAVQYTHKKKGDAGKKEEKLVDAQNAASGRFGVPPAPPRLVASGGK